MKTAKTAAKPAKTTAKTADQKEQEFLRKRESELIAKYPHVLPNTIERGTGTHQGKITVEIACQHPGCSNRRRLASQDCWQVSLCPAHAKVKNAVARKKAKGKAASNGRPTLKEAVTVVKKAQGKGKVDLDKVKVVTDPTIQRLTIKAKAAIIADFKAWSAGHLPEESSDTEINSYWEAAIPAKYKIAAVRTWLLSANKS